MEHSKNFEKVKNYYFTKMWNLKKVQDAVGRWITEEEYEEITGLKKSKNMNFKI